MASPSWRASAVWEIFYQGIFGELYRHYGVSSYKTIRLEQFEAVLKFLDDWRDAAGGFAESDA